jgi:translocation and assembly module TamB
LENPRLEGEMKLSEGFFNLRRQKLTYENVTADVRFTHDQVEIVSFRMKGQKEGAVDMSGFISLDHFHPGEFNIKVTGKDLFIPYQTAIAAKVNTDLKLTGTWDAPDITGNLTITQGRINLDWFYSDAPIDIEIIEVSAPENGTMEILEKESESLPFFDPLFMDIKVNVPGNVWLKGTNENIEINGTFTIKKDRWDMIKLYGPLKTVRGSYRFYGKVFNITEGELTFIGQEDINPPWSAVGEIKIKDVTIIIRLAGDFEKVNLTLDSDPVMDQVDIISYLVFGQPSDSLSQKESFTAGDAALSITGQMAVGEIREILGEKFSIDYLDLSTVGGDIRQGALTMGKYVAPRVFVIYRHGFSQESARQVEVDYEINRNFTIQSQVDNEATSAVDLIWKYEF